jgi:beta-aspartyl-peptidase (threonine type)
LDKDVRHAYAQGLREALAAGAALLDRGESALAAVEAAVLLLEDNPLFNAGKGAVYNASGEHELDAAIMDGHTLQCGAVCGVKSVAHPITLARLVMQRTPHVLLAGSGAEQFARAQGIPAVDSSYFDTPARREAWEKARLIAQNFGMPRDRTSTYGTVGAVARDHRGHLAAATSTGGMTNKAFGRVGDAPIIGAGTYADDCTCAVSCTGTGEEFIRHAAAHELGARIRLAGQSLQDAANSVIFDILKPEDGGLIALGRDGSLALPYSSLGMYRAWIDLKGQAQVAIWDELES